MHLTNTELGSAQRKEYDVAEVSKYLKILKFDK